MIHLIEATILISLAIMPLGSSVSNENLISVIQMFRHGQRTPSSFYPTDPYSDKKFWRGVDPGELTNEGRRQLYALGQFTRNRYSNWLSPEYTSNDFAAFTTKLDRTATSALFNIYGIYSRNVFQTQKQVLDVPSVPIRQADGDIFNSLPLSCPNYFREFVKFLGSDYVTKIDRKYATMYTFLTKKTGRNITDLSGTMPVYDSLKVESEMGLPLPEWAKYVFPQPLQYLTAMGFEIFSHTAILQRLAIGTFLNAIMEHFENMIGDPSSFAKFQLFSGHDSNIVQILNAFGAFENPYPPSYASSIYFELRNGTENYYVNVFSKNSNKLRYISIRECAFDCPLHEVRERLSDIILDVNTRNSECITSTGFVNPFV